MKFANLVSQVPDRPKKEKKELNFWKCKINLTLLREVQQNISIGLSLVEFPVVFQNDCSVKLMFLFLTNYFHNIIGILNIIY